MPWTLYETLNLGIGIIMVGLFILMFYQFAKKKRNLIELLTGLLFGSLGRFLLLFSSLMPGGIAEIVMVISQFFNGLLLFFLYLFIEALTSYPIKIYRFIFTYFFLTLLMFGGFSVLCCIWNNVFNELGNCWLLADTGYNFLGISTFAIGFHAFYSSYTYVKEWQSLALQISSILFIARFTCYVVYDYFYLRLQFLSFEYFAIGGEFFSFIAALILISTYLVNIDYIYRFPFDNYVLLVAYRFGVPLYTSYFKTKKKKIIEPILLSGLMSALSSIYMNILSQEKDYIHHVHGKEAHILIATGKYTSAILVSERTTIYLTRALRRFITEFEKMFSTELSKNTCDSTIFERASILIPKIFPYFKYEKKPRQ